MYNCQQQSKSSQLKIEPNNSGEMRSSREYVMYHLGILQLINIQQKLYLKSNHCTEACFRFVRRQL